jgi:hypothetical protein
LEMRQMQVPKDAVVERRAVHSSPRQSAGDGQTPAIAIVHVSRCRRPKVNIVILRVVCE